MSLKLHGFTEFLWFLKFIFILKILILNVIGIIAYFMFKGETLLYCATSTNGTP